MAKNRGLVELTMAYHTLKYYEAVKMKEETTVYIAMELSQDILLMKMQDEGKMYVWYATTYLRGEKKVYQYTNTHTHGYYYFF